LFDITDSAVEPHDSIAAPGSYMKSIMQSCQVNYGSGFRRADGPDEVVFCMENAINPGPYLTVRGSTPSSYSETATESGVWTALRVNMGWHYNMYEKN
jgi:hypothetical protein